MVSDCFEFSPGVWDGYLELSQARLRAHTAALAQILEAWSAEAWPAESSVFDDIDSLRDESLANSYIRVASVRAVAAAKSWVKIVGRRYPWLRDPLVIQTGDGGVELRWEHGEDFIAANIEETNPRLDTILAEIDGILISEDLDEQNFESLVSTMFADSATQANFVQTPFIRGSAFFDFERTSSTTPDWSYFSRDSIRTGRKGWEASISAIQAEAA